MPSIRPWRRWLESKTVSSECFDVNTGDGVRLTVHRVCPETGEGPAVMLLHGLGANRQIFHFPGRSLAAYLAEVGYDCYLPELRGAGDSECPSYDWGLDEYLGFDLPAVIAGILAKSGRSELHWIGHSLGGVLLFCYGILNPDAPVCSGTTLGSALDYRIGSTSFAHLLKVRVILERLPVIPYGTLAHLGAPLLGRGLTGIIDAFNVCPTNVEPEVLRRIVGTGFNTIPMSLMTSLVTLFGSRGLRTRDRTTYFLEKAERFQIPLRLIGGTRDLQIMPNAVRHTANLVGGPAEVCIYGREHGEVDDYGHLDLVIGRRAPQEVWPGIAEWLIRQDAASEVEQAARAS